MERARKHTLTNSATDHNITIHSVEIAKIGLGVSGGDVCLLENLRRISRPDLKHVLHTTASGRETFVRRGLEPHPETFIYREIGTGKDERLGITAAYAWRTLLALRPPDLGPTASPAVVLSHSDILPTVIYAYRLSRQNHLPWLAWSHMVLPDLTRGYHGHFTGTRSIPSYAFTLSALTQRLSLLLIARRASRVLTINTYTKQQLERCGVPGDRITVIPYGADHLPQVAPTSQVTHRYTAVFVGRFHEQKGVMDLPAVWARVRTDLPDARLAIIGDGPPDITRSLETALAQQGVADSVDLLGFLDDKTKTAVLGSADLLLFPSYYESWGIVALEALCQSRPVVAYDLPVYDGLFDAGMVRSPIGDSAALARAVADLAVDPERRRVLGCAGRKAVLKLRWADSATQITNEVRRAIDN